MENTKPDSNITKEKIRFMNKGNLKHFKAIKEQQLKYTSAPEEQKKLQKIIDNIQKGIDGENEVAYQLRKSGIPMYVLRNVKFIENGSSVESDFIAITKEHIFIIECKNLGSDISVDEMGTFIKKGKEECMENPLTQNLHHVIALKEILLEKERNPIKRQLLKKELEKRLVSYVVFANKKKALTIEDRSLEIEKNVMRSDKLIENMQAAAKERHAHPMSEKKRIAISEFLLNKTKEYKKKYKQKDMKMLLETYRSYQMDKSGFSDVKYVFSDKAIDQIIEKMPESEEEIRKLSGFGDKNTPRYAEGIIEIVGLFRNVE